MNKMTTLLSAAMAGISMGAVACGAGTPAPDNASSATATAQAKHACKGQNACKGQGGCKTDAHSCKGQNDCKGQGGCKG
ncbi:MAG: hypothetical protein ABTD50_01115 [Polyangiaceae bacterium]